jgi:hypothetical protein
MESHPQWRKLLTNAWLKNIIKDLKKAAQTSFCWFAAIISEACRQYQNAIRLNASSTN